MTCWSPPWPVRCATICRNAAAAVEGMNIRAVVPVDLRPSGRALELGNQFGLTFLDMPVGISGPLARLQATKSKMDTIKKSPEAFVFMNIIGFFGLTPKPVEDFALTIFGSKATLVFTNVAGPRDIALLGWRGRGPPDLLGTPSRRSGHGRCHLQLQQHGHGRDRGGCRAGARPGDRSQSNSTVSSPACWRRRSSRLSPPQQQPKPREQPVHCAATTAAGTPCKNRAVAGSSYCRVHQAEEAKSAGELTQRHKGT